MHILIVEDSPDLQDLLVQLFESEGHTVSRANNGREALTLLETSPLPDSILLDIMMPVMDGIEFREQQRNDPRLAAIPVVMMTADLAQRMHAESLGIHAFVKKPLEADQLLETMAQISAI